jgi:hypothetical protein
MFPKCADLLTKDNENNVERDITYQYSSLHLSGNERRLRILELQPGTRQDDIICTLREYPLFNVPPYEALSYCWGDPNDVTPIDIDGFNLNITRSLRSALFHLRRPGEPRLIWADAVCINQQDLVERAQQVSIMGDIYRSAVRTVIWLGPPDSSTARAFTTCARLADYAGTNSLKGKDFAVNAMKEEFDSNDTSVEDLVEKPWW